MNEPGARLSRRDLLRGRFFKAPSAASQTAAPAAPAAAPRPKPFPILRPPGALDEEAFLATCERCGHCVKACTPKAIIVAPKRMKGAAGTPTMDLLNAPCLLCADRPCAAACPSGALSLTRPVKIGMARILEYHCTAHQKGSCSVCVDRCPVPGAIVVTEKKPRIDPAHCVGCGQCQSACPATTNAILVLPPPLARALP